MVIVLLEIHHLPPPVADSLHGQRISSLLASLSSMTLDLYRTSAHSDYQFCLLCMPPLVAGRSPVEEVPSAAGSLFGTRNPAVGALKTPSFWPGRQQVYIRHWLTAPPKVRIAAATTGRARGQPASS